MSDKEQRFDHESYGLVGLSRITSTGNHRLFMSALSSHHTMMRLRIHEAYMTRGEIMGDQVRAGRQIVEVCLSSAQFAELITTPNVGEGIPCTILRHHGRMMADPPPINSEPENIRETLQERLATVRERLASKMTAVLDSLPSGTSAKARERVQTALHGMAREITDHVPFALKNFQEATTRVAAAAKAEVDAMLTHVVQMTGLQVLRERAGLPALPEHTEPTPSTDNTPPPEGP